MNILFETKAEIVKGVSKSGNDFYAIKVYLTKDYAKFDLLQNADLELVKSMEKNLISNNKNDE